MVTTRRTIIDDDRQGGYTTTVNRAAPVFNFSNRAPRADVSGYTEYEIDRIDAMQRQQRQAPEITEMPVRRSQQAPRRVYSEEDLMPSIQTMQTAKTGKLKQASVARRIGREPNEKIKGTRKPLSENAKLLIGVYVAIAFIALVLIIATGIAVNRSSDRAAAREAERSGLQTEVTAQQQQIAYFTPMPASADYEPVNDAEVIAFAVKPLSERTVYTAQSNWFDRICDFFSGLWS